MYQDIINQLAMTLDIGSFVMVVCQNRRRWKARAGSMYLDLDLVVFK
jgi:hypothetical protein